MLINNKLNVYYISMFMISKLIKLCKITNNKLHLFEMNRKPNIFRNVGNVKT